MLRRTLAACLTTGLAIVLLPSCNSSKSTSGPTGTGTVMTFIGDAPFCDALSFRLLITGLTLTPKGGGNKVSVLPSSASIKVEITSLRDSSTILNLASATEGTYDEATFALTVPQITVFDPTKSPPVTTLTGTLTTASPAVTIEPALTVTKGQLSALRVDFDLRRSLEVDAQGQITGNVTPVLRVSPVSASDSQTLAQFDDLVGFVRSVTPSSTGAGFTGGFSLQLLSGSGPALTVNLTSATQLFGVPALNQLLTGSFVEIEGFVDAKGNLVANTVEVEEQEFVDQKKVAFIGAVTSATKDANGNITQFDLFIRQEEPDASYTVPVDSIVVVSVSPSTVLQFSSRATNFANLPFDATAFAPGQEVVVHGTYTTTTGEPTTVAADKVYLKLQTAQGSFSTLVQAGSDDKTGAFRLAPCCSVFQGAPILVLTNNQTTFLNVSGLSGLTPQPSLLLKGLLFYEAAGGTINGVAVPPGTLVMLTKQVHQY